jgi:6-pyruvoyltetrahydropterin/6-carboxytetrahydropterin synthase
VNTYAQADEPLALTTALAGFESARRLATLHGHGFTASVAAALPAGWAPFKGGEVSALEQLLLSAVRPLDQALLNEHLPEPTDTRLGRWISERLELPVPARISVQSSARQGADLRPGTPARLWRRYRFQSAHRLPNVAPKHKCGRMHGHGFEALVQVSAEDPALGYDAIDAAWAPLHMQLNYNCLNEIAGLSNPTSEVLAAWLWRQLQAALPALCGIAVFETASCGAHFDGQAHRIWKDFSFDSAAVLRHAPLGHPRAALHGHTYLLRLHLQAPLDERLGWAVDFGDVKTLFGPVFDAIDHRPLQQIAGLEDGDTATLARWIQARARERLPQLVRTDLFETRGCGTLLVPSAGEIPLLPP